MFLSHSLCYAELHELQFAIIRLKLRHIFDLKWVKRLPYLKYHWLARSESFGAQTFRGIFFNSARSDEALPFRDYHNIIDRIMKRNRPRITIPSLLKPESPRPELAEPSPIVFDSSGSVELGTFSPFAETTLIDLLTFFESSFFNEDESFQKGFQGKTNRNWFLGQKIIVDYPDLIVLKVQGWSVCIIWSCKHPSFWIFCDIIISDSFHKLIQDSRLDFNRFQEK